MIEVIRRARRDLISAANNIAEALKIAQRDFGLPESMPLRRLIDFAERWSNKPKQIVEQGTLQEFLEYVNLFGDAGGALLEETDDDDPVAALAPQELGNAPREDAVQLMTVHAAKGLEFPCVFVARAASGSFPSNYKEPLVEFPRQLRSKDTAADADARTQHDQEERRLFYVSMTRAMDELYLCGKVGRGKNPIPTRYIRELVDAKLALKDDIAARVLQPEADREHPRRRRTPAQCFPVDATSRARRRTSARVERQRHPAIRELSAGLQAEVRLAPAGEHIGGLAVRQRHASGS